MSEPEVREITSTGEWLDWRRANVNASEIGALFGVHPFLTLEQMVATKSDVSVKGDTPSMRAGRLLEAVFPAAVKEERPEWDLVRATSYHWRPDLHLGATPDFWIGDDGIFESKTMNERDWERCHGRPPLYFILQILTQLIVTRRKWGALGIIVRNSSLPLYLFDVPRHPAAEAKILDAVADFWARHDAGEFPAAAPKDELEAMLDDGSHKDLSNDNWLPEALERRETLLATRGEADKAVKEIDYGIKTRLGTASNAWLAGWVISWRSQYRREYIVPAADIRRLLVKRTAAEDEG